LFAESCDAEEVGSDGRGYVWKKEVDSDGEDEQELIDFWGKKSHLTFSYEVIIRCIF
jgi:hypothetical protein